MFISLPCRYTKLYKGYYSFDYTMKLQQLKSGQYFLSLPRQIVRAKGWKKGDVINITINSKGDLVLTK